ncbi:MAG: hypothetical protein EDM79_15400 [Chloroflexi bacterium]|nr:MAG: hypothetical protein EDM79_15400 [Chloroflexota bacterium]
MPRLSVWFIRASLIYLLLGSFFGALLLAQKGISFYPPIWYLFPLHMEFLLVGWLIQLAMGVAFWIFPRFSNGQSRGNKPLIWISFALVNAGILIGILQFWSPIALLIGRVFEVGAGIVFAAGLWRRVKPHGVL